MLNHSDHHPILFLSNLVEGTYTFHLHVTDAKGESDTDRTTVEVKPGEFIWRWDWVGLPAQPSGTSVLGPLLPSKNRAKWQSQLLNTLETPS